MEVRVDEKGRVLLPKSFREAVGIEAGGLARVEVRGGEVVLAPVKGAAERFYGLARCKVARRPRRVHRAGGEGALAGAAYVDVNVFA